MPISALEKLLAVDRSRRYMSRHGDFAAPVLHERSGSSKTEGPFVVSSSKGRFVETQIRPDASVWASFFECGLDEEDATLAALYADLGRASRANAWGNRAATVPEGMDLMWELGFEPKAITLATDLVAEVCGISSEDSAKVAAKSSYIADVGGIRFYACSALPSRAALITTTPALAGAYVRVSNSLAIIAQQANRSVVLVGGDGVA